MEKTTNIWNKMRKRKDFTELEALETENRALEAG